MITELHELSWAKVFRHMLMFVEQGYQIPRKLKLAGKDNQFIVTELEGRMLRGNNDVRVRRGSSLPNSKTLKRQDIVNTMSLGLLGDPKSNPQVAMNILDELEFGQSENMWQDLKIDSAQIKRGMDAMERGEQIEVNQKDNNVFWCQELNRFRKSEKFGQLPEEIQRLFEANLEDRLNQLMPPNPANTPMPSLPPMPPPPIGAGGEAFAGVPQGTRSSALAEKAQSMQNVKQMKRGIGPRTLGNPQMKG